MKNMKVERQGKCYYYTGKKLPFTKRTKMYL